MSRPFTWKVLLLRSVNTPSILIMAFWPSFKVAASPWVAPSTRSGVPNSFCIALLSFSSTTLITSPEAVMRPSSKESTPPVFSASSESFVALSRALPSLSFNPVKPICARVVSPVATLLTVLPPKKAAFKSPAFAAASTIAGSSGLLTLDFTVTAAPLFTTRLPSLSKLIFPVPKALSIWVFSSLITSSLVYVLPSFFGMEKLCSVPFTLMVNLPWSMVASSAKGELPVIWPKVSLLDTALLPVARFPSAPLPNRAFSRLPSVWLMVISRPAPDSDASKVKLSSCTR